VEQGQAGVDKLAANTVVRMKGVTERIASNKQKLMKQLDDLTSDIKKLERKLYERNIYSGGFSTEEKKRLKQKIFRLWDEADNLKVEIEDASKTAREKMLEVLKESRPGKGKLVAKSVAKKSEYQGMVDGAVDFLNDVTGKKKGKLDDVVWQTSKSRSYYSSSSKAAVINPERGVDVIVHEFGHHLEHNMKNLQKAARKFLNDRTKRESLKKLKELFPYHGYRPSEVTKVDNFIHAYMGKHYAHNSTELISMGLEYLYAQPAEFLAKDPDMVEWLLRTLWGAAEGTL
jgi:flagellar biosynthesis chaperone FliJ